MDKNEKDTNKKIVGEAGQHAEKFDLKLAAAFAGFEFIIVLGAFDK